MSGKRAMVAAVAAAVLGAGLAVHAGVASGADSTDFPHRGDIVSLPKDLKDRLIEQAGRPSTYQPMQAFAEATNADGSPKPSQLVQYALLDTKNFQPNQFTSIIPGVNDGVPPTATGPNHNQPTIGATRVVVEPKPGLPTDPNDPGAFIDMFTDISGLFVINNESGWYEGWMIHDVTVPQVAAPRADKHAAFGTITQADADALKKRGTGNNTPGHVFSVDGNAPHTPAATDHYPDKVSNTVPVQLSLGAYNATQQSDLHSYWEFNEYTDWTPPTYELPFTGGLPGTPQFAQNSPSIVPGSGPAGKKNSPQKFGDVPNLPRDPDRILDNDASTPTNDDHKEQRLRFLPSGLSNEVLLDAYVRPASFEPYKTNLSERIFDAYAQEVARIDTNHDGVVQATEADVEGTSDGGQSNDRLFLPAPAFNRMAVTREINDGLLSPRFAPSQRAWVLSGDFTLLKPPFPPASTAQDGDNR
ncbi:hypothetical protein [Actinomadura rupiterrae]|uniref:hypothetical protein n=1 Tax=Actinomadura rupiterrae TaxID=559627 RepID=UPI0020A30D5E|nr:hypothetical protein [Actinomadura rupiterrae]MCP2337623.1 hypothetical protein [Actinomadura rupiterrae]